MAISMHADRPVGGAFAPRRAASAQYFLAKPRYRRDLPPRARTAALESSRVERRLFRGENAMLKGVNWIAVIIAVVLLQVLGFLWFGPVFGKAWAAAMGKTGDMSGGSNMLMALGAVNTLICVVGLAWLLGKVGAATLGAAITTSVTAWFFFSFTTSSLEYIYMGMSLQLLELNAGYLLVAFVLAGATLNLVKFGAPAAATA
jgi:hypothetical protein